MMVLEIVKLDEASIDSVMDDLVNLLCDAVNGGASVNFVSPLSTDESLNYWQKIRPEIEKGERSIIVARDDERIVGCVHLVPCWQPNAQHRAEVQKLLVHSDYRRQGIARQLLAAVEVEARSLGRLLLYLDTERYSVAEWLYRDWGYTQIGIIPLHSLNGQGELADTVLFYRWLPD